MGFAAGQPIAGHEDRRRVHRVVHERPAVRPARSRADRGAASRSRRTCARSSCRDRRPCAPAAEREGLDEVFRDAGFDWRGAGCSMCLAMNPDRLEGREICASSSNRNFKGRQGSPTGRTLLMSPAMVAAAAVAGEVVDVRGWATGRRATHDRTHRAHRRPRRIVLRGRRHRHRSDHAGAVPARPITFEGLEAHLFEDDRARAARRAARRIRSTIPRGSGARVLIVGANFGCGSSREHAPQAIRALGHSRDRRRVVRGDLLRQRADDRPAVRDRAARAETRRADGSAPTPTRR